MAGRLRHLSCPLAPVKCVYLNARIRKAAFWKGVEDQYIGLGAANHNGCRRPCIRDDRANLMSSNGAEHGATSVAVLIEKKVS